MYVTACMHWASSLLGVATKEGSVRYNQRSCMRYGRPRRWIRLRLRRCHARCLAPHACSRARGARVQGAAHRAPCVQGARRKHVAAKLHLSGSMGLLSVSQAQLSGSPATWPGLGQYTLAHEAAPCCKGLQLKSSAALPSGSNCRMACTKPSCCGPKSQLCWRQASRALKLNECLAVMGSFRW